MVYFLMKMYKYKKMKRLKRSCSLGFFGVLGGCDLVKPHEANDFNGLT
jgi:hypothetical protein